MRANGYPIQRFTVTTEDGFILQIHRIPFGRINPSTDHHHRPAVFLQHGLFCSSADWVFLAPNQSLGEKAVVPQCCSAAVPTALQYGSAHCAAVYECLSSTVQSDIDAVL